MQFFTIVAILTTVVIAENAEAGAAIASPALGAWTILTIAGLALVGCQMFAAVICRRPTAADRLSNYFRVWRRLQLALSWAGVVFVLHYCGWASRISDWSQNSALFLVDELVLFAPAILPLLVLWAAQFDVELAFQRGAVEPFWRTWRERRSYVGSHARHHLLLIMAPLLLMLCIDDVLRLFATEAQLEAFGWIFYGVMVLALVWLFPLLLRCIWRTGPLPDSQLADRLDQVTREQGLRVRSFLLWKTDHRMLNAAVTGFTRRFRYVLLTDGLLQNLNVGQIESVVRHEAAHIQRGHMGLRLALLMFPLWLVLNALLAFPEHPWIVWLTELDRWPLLACTIAYSVYAIAMLGWISRQLEYDADLVACWDQSISPGRTWEFIGTLQRIADISGENPGKRHWLHPSLRERARFLKAGLDNPQVAESFRHRIRHLRVATWVLLGATSGVIWSLGLFA